MENKKLNEFKKNIKGKNIAVLGIGVSNIPAIQYLYNMGASITAIDKNEVLGSECDILKELNIKYKLGSKELPNLKDFDYILRSPGIKPFSKEIEDAVASGVILTSEIELLLELAPCKIIGVTGSDGKTTTTTLISKFLEKSGFKVWLGGNIGIPLFSRLDEINEDDIVVVELSSFQLMSATKSPNISIITNISPNHLDYHRSYGEYINAKANIFLHQNENDIIILNNDDELSLTYFDLINKGKINSKVRYFSVVDNLKNGVYLKDGNIVSSILGTEEIVCDIESIKLVGIHNLANICAAASAVINLTGVNPIKEVITTFGGVEHRMELVRIKNGIKWYNDSIASSPTRTIAGLNSFNNKIILIAGGYDKNIPYDVMGGYILDKVKTLLLIGKTAPKIEKAVIDEAKKRNIKLEEIIKIINFATLDECVYYANSNCNSGDIVVLSPASASFDMYKNFEQRGDHFKKLINKI